MNKQRSFILLVLIVTLVAGCLPSPYFQKDEAIPGNAWAYSFKPSFTFDITDTAASYQPSLLIRHTQAYPYSNIWMWVYVKAPGDSIAKRTRINVTLAEASGKWLGRGMGEIFEQRLKMDLGDSLKLNKPGTWQIAFEQNMRITPLPDVLNIGLRVEKTQAAHK